MSLFKTVTMTSTIYGLTATCGECGATVAGATRRVWSWAQVHMRLTCKEHRRLSGQGQQVEISCTCMGIDGKHFPTCAKVMTP